MATRIPIKRRNTPVWVPELRISILIALIIVLSCILILRLAYLQLAEYKRFATLSLRNQMNIRPIPPPRGIILDRQGVVLAENRPVYGLDIIPERIKSLPDTLNQLTRLLPSITPADIANFYRLRRQNRAYIPIPLKLQLSQDEVATFALNQFRFPGVLLKTQLLRFYPFGETTAHVIGYVGRINLQELRQLDHLNYQGTDFVGKAGIENYYENTLHGQVGYQQVETNVSGRTVRVLSQQPPHSGEKLVLTLDIRLQQIAHQALQSHQGALVLMDVNNGGILAMTSTPAFDPNTFVNGISGQEYQQLLHAPDRPLYNRAIRGQYPPASTIKPFIAITGLEKEAITPSQGIYDPGWYRLPGIKHAYRDWKRHGHGIVNLKRAIMVSCDTYFYQLGNRLGILAIEDMLKQFGFGLFTHIDLHEEAPGLVPSPQWKRQTKHLPWYPGDSLITSIGQGFMLASPLQLANAIAALSQHGKRFRPHLLSYTLDDQQHTTHYVPLEEYPILLKHSDYWNWVTEAMQAVINNNEGTGYRFGRNAPYSVAGKTGTAQVFSLSQNDNQTNRYLPLALRDHSLFIAFAPVENPQVAIAVIVEHDVIAAQVARTVLDAYFSLYPVKP